MKFAIYLCLGSWLWLAAIGRGQAPNDSPAANPPDGTESIRLPDISVKFAKDSYRSISVDEAITLEVQISNTSHSSAGTRDTTTAKAQDIQITEVTLEMPAAFARTRPPYVPQPDEVSERQRPKETDWLIERYHKEIALEQGKFRSVPIRIPKSVGIIDAWKAIFTGDTPQPSSQNPGSEDSSPTPTPATPIPTPAASVAAPVSSPNSNSPSTTPAGRPLVPSTAQPSLRDADWTQVGAWLSTLEFFTSDCDFVAHVFYRVNGEEIRHETTTRTLRVQSSGYAILLGAVGGCLLASLFRISYAVSRQLLPVWARRTDLPTANVFVRAWHACATLICGLITALITTLLCQILKDVPGFPLKISADSVSGGLIIGLISYRLGGWMNEFLVGRSDDPAKVAATNPDAETPSS